MATTEFTAPARSGGGFLRLVATGLERAAALWAAYRNRRAVAQLLGFDARMLRDIGLAPGDVHSALASPLSEDPSRHLTALSAERRSAFLAQSRETRGRRHYPPRIR